jgi:trans-aconitate 2-methyltransferase
VGLRADSVHPLEWYVRLLMEFGCAVNAWQTIYLHVLSGTNPVLEWFKGTALRPLLAKLSVHEQFAFQQELGERLSQRYPQQNGVTLFPFPRLFVVATKPGHC